MKPFQIPAILIGANRKTDKSLSLRFSTNEVSTEEFMEIDQYHQTFGYLLFQPNRFSDNDLPSTDAPDERKTPSQRLRSVMYLLHKQEGGDKGGFQSFYENQMEKIIEHLKAKLD